MNTESQEQKSRGSTFLVGRDVSAHEVSEAATGKLERLRTELNTAKAETIDQTDINETPNEAIRPSEEGENKNGTSTTSWTEITTNLEGALTEITAIANEHNATIENLVALAQTSPALKKLLESNPKVAMVIWRRIACRYALLTTPVKAHAFVLSRFGARMDFSEKLKANFRYGFRIGIAASEKSIRRGIRKQLRNGGDDRGIREIKTDVNDCYVMLKYFGTYQEYFSQIRLLEDGRFALYEITYWEYRNFKMHEKHVPVKKIVKAMYAKG